MDKGRRSNLGKWDEIDTIRKPVDLPSSYPESETCLPHSSCANQGDQTAAAITDQAGELCQLFPIPNERCGRQITLNIGMGGRTIERETGKVEPVEGYFSVSSGNESMAVGFLDV